MGLFDEIQELANFFGTSISNQVDNDDFDVDQYLNGTSTQEKTQPAQNYVEKVDKPFDIDEVIAELSRIANKYGLSKYAIYKLATWASYEAGKTIHNNNPGNIRPTKNDKFYINVGKVNEFDENGKETIAKGLNDPMRKFKSFDSLSEGLEAMISWLRRNHPNAWNAIIDDRQSIEQFGSTLGTKDLRGLKYYTGNQKTYSSGLKNRFNQYFKAV